VRIFVISITIVLSLWMQPLPVRAEQVPVYAGSTLVNSSKIDFSSPAFAAAWVNALARYTGKTEAQLRHIPGLVPADLAKAIERYYFEAVPPEFWPGTEPVYWLHVFANKRRLRQLTRDANLPIWPAERETTIVWLLDETGGMPQLAANSRDTAAAYWLQKRAEQAGLPLRWANNAATMPESVSLDALRRLSSSVVDYAHDAFGFKPVLLLSLSPLAVSAHTALGKKAVGSTSDENLQRSAARPLQWRMAFAMPDETLTRYHGTAATPDIAARQVIAKLRQWQSARERLYPEERKSHEISLQINGLREYSEVDSTLKALSRLSVVEDYLIERFRPGQIQLKLHLGVTTEAFLRYLQQAGRFRIIQREPLVLEKL